MNEIYTHISNLILKYAELHDGESIVRLMIRVYMDGNKKDREPISSEERESTLSSIIQDRLSEIDPITARVISNRKRSYPRDIKGLKPRRTKLKQFIVADTETLMENNQHKVYAAGLLLVRPGQQINPIMI